MKILITGATGFAGKHLVKKLHSDGHTVHAIVRPSSDLSFLISENIPHFVFTGAIQELTVFLQKEKFDGIIHLASLFLTQHTPENVKDLVDSNILFPTLLLESAVANKIPWFINTGTFWQHYLDKKYSPINLYAATKQAFEDMAQYYIETSDINFVTIKLFNMFGPQDTRPKVFNLWLKISQSKETLDMSPGKQIIDITYIDNVVAGYGRMIELLSRDSKHKLKGQSFVIPSKQRMTLKKLSELFEKVTGVKLNIKWGAKEYRPREVMVPLKKGKLIPGWKPVVSLEEGIRRTFNQK